MLLPFFLLSFVRIVLTNESNTANAVNWFERRARGVIFVEGQPVVRVSAFVNTKSILPTGRLRRLRFRRPFERFVPPTIRDRVLDRVLLPFRKRTSRGQSRLFVEISNVYSSLEPIRTSRWRYKERGIELAAAREERHKLLLSLIYRCQGKGRGGLFSL